MVVLPEDQADIESGSTVPFISYDVAAVERVCAIAHARTVSMPRCRIRAQGIHGTARARDPRLSVAVSGIDHEGNRVDTAVVVERPLTLFLNAREIVTMMTIGDRPDLLAVGYL